MNAPAVTPAPEGGAHLVPVIGGGAEKMVYDLRSGPQVLEHNGALYAAVLLHDHEAVPHPHVMVRPAGTDHFDAAFYCVRRRRGQWLRQRLCATNSTWNGCNIRLTAQGFITDHVVATDDSRRMYGGGRLQRWSSTDGGRWAFESELDSDPDVLLNNPKWIERSDGSSPDAHLICFGWRGPDSLQSIAGNHGDPPAVTATLYVNQLPGTPS